MSWKIKNIEITNVKAFKDTFSLNVEGKNVLLFGENGSGKSSIYWSLYTFFQSVLKPPTKDGAQKYFDPKNDQHLRNRFSLPDDYSGIKVKFVDVDTNENEELEDSSNVVNTDKIDKMSLMYSLHASDFLNYKYLSSIFDFRNSKINDVYEIFNREIFPVESLSQGFKDINGKELDKNVKFWWDKLNEELNKLPKGKGKNKNHIARNTIEWAWFKSQFDIFNSELEKWLFNIELKANAILQSKLGIAVDIVIQYEKADCPKILPKAVNGTLKLVDPHILIKARMKHTAIKEADITHPRSFFNEATLTSMALALRLAVTEDRLTSPVDSCKVLFIDDLLISLDMVNRLKVIDILLGYAGKFQLFIFTHDRDFYNVVSNKIAEQSSQWLKYQLYVKSSFNKDDIPSFVLANIKSGLDTAKEFYLRGEFEAAIVTLRKECEAQLKRLLPLDAIIDAKAACRGEIKPVDLSKMLNKLQNKLYDLHSCPNVTPDLHTFRALLLNQAAHNDYSTPIFQDEIKQAFDAIEKLSKIKRTYWIDNRHIGLDHYKFKITTPGGVTKEIEFSFADIFSAIEVDGKIYLNDPLIKITSTGKMPKLNDAISDLCAKHGLGVPPNEDLLHMITNQKTLKPFID
jgi:hypothetical protein